MADSGSSLQKAPRCPLTESGPVRAMVEWLAEGKKEPDGVWTHFFWTRLGLRGMASAD